MRITEHLLRSSIGRKTLMAITGILLVLFLIGHLAGNLQMFAGQDAMNSYAAFLKSKTALIWTARIGLVVLFLLHMKLAGELKAQNARARPVGYRKNKSIQASFASRRMLMSGMVIFAFLVYHILHYTAGVVHEEFFHLTDDLGRHDVYGMVIASFREPVISAAYLISVFLLSLHLRHAIPSFFQTMGWHHPGFQKTVDIAGILFAVLLFAGYASIPAAIYFHII